MRSCRTTRRSFLWQPANTGARPGSTGGRSFKRLGARLSRRHRMTIWPENVHTTFPPGRQLTQRRRRQMWVRLKTRASRLPRKRLQLPRPGRQLCRLRAQARVTKTNLLTSTGDELAFCALSTTFTLSLSSPLPDPPPPRPPSPRAPPHSHTRANKRHLQPISDNRTYNSPCPPTARISNSPSASSISTHMQVISSS